MTSAIGSLTDLRSSTTALVLGVEAERWSDADVREPSLLPGWTRAHVLTHIARNADSISRTVSGALRGEVVARYPDGVAGRNADIEVGAAGTSIELMADLRESAERLDRVFAAAADVDGWDLPTEDRSVREYVTVRWREVEVHRVDLGGAYTPADWPPAFVSYLVPTLIQRVSDRTRDALRIAVAVDGSVTTDLPGERWTVGSAEPIDVAGPDWAIAAWLTGRAAAAAAVLTATPQLAAWI
jgi:maleylpyruvate isomerase